MAGPDIHLEALTRRFGKQVAVDNVTLDVPSGGVFALMGRNGAGKTTLIRSMLGLIPRTAGSVSVLGLDPALNPRAVRAQTGYVPEQHGMPSWMTVREVARFVSAFHVDWDPALCARLIARLDLPLDAKIGSLSRGMAAKVNLVLALSFRPQLLVLDEPTSGLDAVVRRDFLASIVEVAAQERRTVFISSHQLNDVERIADRVALMDAGHIRLVEDLASLKERMREIRVTFDDGAPARFSMDGIVSLTREPNQWLMVTESYGPDTLTQLETKLPGAMFEVRNMSLEEIFIVCVERKAP